MNEAPHTCLELERLAIDTAARQGELRVMLCNPELSPQRGTTTSQLWCIASHPLAGLPTAVTTRLYSSDRHAPWSVLISIPEEARQLTQLCSAEVQRSNITYFYNQVVAPLGLVVTWASISWKMILACLTDFQSRRASVYLTILDAKSG